MNTRDGVSDVVQVFWAARTAASEQHRAGLGGRDLTRALAASMDDVLLPLFEQIEVPGVALVALGGYARGELSPHSDLDLMILHDGVRDVGERAERLFYPLWDAGLTVGNAVRTPKECLRLAKDNLETETSFLRMRLIGGDAPLHDDLARAALAQTRRRGTRFIADVDAMMRTRHAAHGTATSQLEPNLKHGTGGLRDLHVLDWMSTVFPDVMAPDTVFPETDRAHLDEAMEFLLRVRNELHYRNDRAHDVLLFHHQRPIAQFLCYLDGERPAEDAFMRDLFAHTRRVEHIVSGVMATLTRPAGAPPDPAARVIDALRIASDGDVTVPWSEPLRRAFLALLRLGDAAALESADHAGLLARLLPEWDAVRCQPQHNVYHHFTVDAHLFEAVAAVARMLVAPSEQNGQTDQVVRDAVADLRDPDTLLLAAFLHDAGKGTDEDHAERGERLARAILARAGFDQSRADTICWLVRHHLLLVEAAMRRDLDDENVIVETAVRIGDADRARLLFLLSVADGRATSESAWTPWKATLVTELFTKVRHVLERGEVATPDAVDLARVRATELRRGLAHHPDAEVQAHLDGMPRAYLLAFTPEELIRHFALMSRVDSGNGAVPHALAGNERGGFTYAVAARDRPGLFATVSGVLALNGVNILTAQGFIRADGLAIEVFRCHAPAIDSAGIDNTDVERFAQIDADLDRALTGKVALEVRLAERRDAYARAPRTRHRAPEVVIDNTASDFSTVVEVHARDRIGLLYDVTRAMADLSIDIALAKIATYGEDVVDVFYVRDLQGQKLTDAAHLDELRRSLLFRLGTDPLPGTA